MAVGLLMTSLSKRRSRYTAGAIALLAATLVPGLNQLPALADDPVATPGVAPQAKVPDLSTTFRGLGDPVPGLIDTDTRGRALPSLTQRRAASTLGGVDLRWNRFGTPASILPTDGSLARATASDPVSAARGWLRRNAALFGISTAQVADMVATEQRLIYSDASAVFFRQRFDGLLPALGSAVTVGVAKGQIAYVSSSITKTDQALPEATVSAATGWLRAAESVGLDLGESEIAQIVRTVSGGWTRLAVPGVVQEQQVRLRALADADGSVRPVLEANVVDVQGGTSSAYTVLVDAVDASILHRENQVENLGDMPGSPSTVVTGATSAPAAGLARSDGAFPFMGSITAAACGPRHPFVLSDGQTKSIAVVASALNAANDITINLYDPSGAVIASQDLLTSPEALTYTAGSIPAGTYRAEVCPFDGAAFVAPGNYTATVVTSDAVVGGGGLPGSDDYNPRWRFFAANPTLDSPAQTPRNSAIGCWLTAPGCTLSTGRFNNVQAFAPWDVLTATGRSSLTTSGNNALTREAWASPLTPGGLAQAPISATGRYTTGFTDAWNNSRCNPAELVPGGNDILFSVGNLFVNHNRMHDYSFYLGFTEKNYNLQLDNVGRGGVESDPEVGNVQAGAIGGLQSGLGRDNANQIALQDGVPGITNQYLFQPIAGAFYAPCTDGGLDMGIVGHEYTHAISNRMVGGPDEGLTSAAGGAMGESWSDLVAAEYQFGHGYKNGGNIFAVGVYATGNKRTAIRNYAMNHSPLNYSNVGYDVTGPQVHADGEIWSGINWEVRQALVKKFNQRFPYSDKSLQLECAQAHPIKGVLRPYKCPGNRRWMQLVFDAFLLQQGATSMLDARDAMIAADKMRFGGANKEVLWDAFARRGMGVGASAKDGEDSAPRPSFTSIGGASQNTKVTFKTSSPGEIFVGDFEARVRPIADTVAKTRISSSASFTPGTYDLLYVGATHGFMRFKMTVAPGQRAKVVRVTTSRNLAAAKSGAKVIRSTAGGRNPGQLIDGTEVFSWAGVTAGNVDATRPSIDVDLAGSKASTVRTVAVSAYLRPAYGADADAGSRFTALRKFAIEACMSRCTTAGAKFRRVFVSKDNAFPSSQPRPVAPTLNMRAFRIKPTRAAALRLVVLENQCTGGPDFAGDQDDDPLNTTDCKAGSDRGTIVHVAELQAFASNFPSWKSSYGIESPERSTR